MSLYECCARVGSYSKGTPVGKDTKLGEYDAYITGDQSSKKALLIVHDVYGWTFNNTRVLADRLAKEIRGCVYLPDLMNGEDWTLEKKKNPDWVVNFPDFLSKHHPRDGWQFAVKAVEEIRKLQPGAKIGAQGYCWGALPVLHLASDAAGENKVDAAGMAHPTLVEIADFEKVTVPIQVLCAETDAQFTEEKRVGSIEVLKKLAKDAGIFSKWGYFPNVSHGWTIKGDENDPYSAKAMAHASNDTAAFFKQELA